MATTRIILPVPAPELPDGSGTGNNPAPWEKIISTGTQTTNTPKVSNHQHLFDAATDAHVLWQFPLLGDYVSGGLLRFWWGSKGTTGNVIWKVSALALISGITDADVAVFPAPILTSPAEAVPATIGIVQSSTLTPTATNFAANRLIVLSLGRDADNASDTSTAVATLLGAVFEYVS